MSKELLYEKKIDKSLVRYGTTVPTEVVEKVTPLLGLDKIERGDGHKIMLRVGGQTFVLSLHSVDFNKNKWHRAEIWRLLWHGQVKEIQSALRVLFPLAFAYFDGVDSVFSNKEAVSEEELMNEAEENGSKKGSKLPKLPEEYAERVCFYYDTANPDQWYIERGEGVASVRQGGAALIDEPLQKIVQGAPGTGKSHLLKNKTEGYETIRTTFHPDSDYATFVGSYRPEKVKDSDKITYGFVAQSFTEAYVAAWKKRACGKEPVFLVIEEINRGNCAQIFGDLFQLLDRRDDGFSDYPIRPNAALRRYLEEDAFKDLTFDEKARKDIALKFSSESPDIVGDILSGKVLVLPDNLYIWATMNTSDQSLFPIDSAFKRRWEWQYVPIQDEGKGVKIAVGKDNYSWWSFLEKINTVIGSAAHSEDKKLGYYFIKSKDGVIDSDRFVGKVVFYLWNDVFKIFGFDDKCFRVKDGEKDRVLTLQDFFLKDGKPNVDSLRTFLVNLGVEIATA